MKRSSGILLNISSLPSPYGIGTLGKSAYEFVDFLVKSAQSYWQVLPINPTSYGDSPYQSFSSYAGNPYFIDFDLLIEQGCISRQDILHFPKKSTGVTDYEMLYTHKYHILKKAFENSFNEKDEDYLEFVSNNCYWLEDYAIFMTAKGEHKGKSWQHWEDAPLKAYEENYIREYQHHHKAQIDFWQYIQFLFYKQYTALKRYANGKGIKIIGDIPIYVAADSADVWGNKEFFYFDDDYNPKYVSGCPPDYFSADGQLWGNPVYNWEYLKNTEYKWWLARLKGVQSYYDVIRIDHFRGFEAYYSIDFLEETARNGRWVKGPGIDFINKIKQEIKDIEIIAEDLGYLTPEVHALLEQSGYPGMKVLQFAFDSNEENDYLPHSYTRNCVVYTGTHDNNTTCGWFEHSSKKDWESAVRYGALTKAEGYVWGMIRLAMSSVANLAVIPMQDYLNLGEKCRMNEPSTIGKNWKWRLTGEENLDELSERIAQITRLYGRI